MSIKIRPQSAASRLFLVAVISASGLALAQQPTPVRTKAPVVQQKVVFTDLENYSTEAPAINDMVAQGIIKQASPGIFNPEGVVTRGDFATMVQTLFQLTKPAEPVAFSDLKTTDPIYGAVQSMAPFMNRQALCRGCALSTNFSPNVAISREEAAVILVRILGSRNLVQQLSDSDLNTFLSSTPDAKNWKPFAAPYFAVAIKSGIIPLLGDNTFQPAMKLTRVSTAVVLDSVHQRFIAPVLIHGPVVTPTPIHQ